MGLWGSEMPPLRRLERVVLGTHRHRCVLLLLFLPIFPVKETDSHGRLIRGIVKLGKVFQVCFPCSSPAGHNPASPTDIFPTPQ